MWLICCWWLGFVSRPADSFFNSLTFTWDSADVYLTDLRLFQKVTQEYKNNTVRVQTEQTESKKRPNIMCIFHHID